MGGGRWRRGWLMARGKPVEWGSEPHVLLTLALQPLDALPLSHK